MSLPLCRLSYLSFKFLFLLHISIFTLLIIFHIPTSAFSYRLHSCLYVFHRPLYRCLCVSTYPQLFDLCVSYPLHLFSISIIAIVTVIASKDTSSTSLSSLLRRWHHLQHLLVSSSTLHFLAFIDIKCSSSWEDRTWSLTSLVFQFLERTAHGRSCPLVFQFLERTAHGRSRRWCSFLH